MLSAAALRAAALKQETLSDWNGYLSHEKVEVQKRATVGTEFLWADDDPSRLERIKNGEIIVAPVGVHEPLRVSSGLIHHWIGATFIPNARIEDVMAVTRDYEHYKDYYRPGVQDAKTISSGNTEDQFTIIFANNSILSKTSLEGEYVCDYTRVSDARWYSESETRQMEEVKNSGKPDEARLAPDQGAGYIWRLYSTARLAELDGGVLVELEAIALSRDVPGSLHWFVDPIIRRISRESLQKSLEETAEAVRSRKQSIAQSSR